MPVIGPPVIDEDEVIEPTADIVVADTVVADTEDELIVPVDVRLPFSVIAGTVNVPGIDVLPLASKRVKVRFNVANAP